MYFRVNLKMIKPTLLCCFTRIIFIKLNFTVAFLLIRKTWDDRFPGKVGGMEDFKKWGRYRFPSKVGEMEDFMKWGRS